MNEIIDNFHAFMQSQLNKINYDKWLASEKAGHDLGQNYIFDWIEHNAKQFRKDWIEKNKL